VLLFPNAGHTGGGSEAYWPNPADVPVPHSGFPCAYRSPGPELILLHQLKLILFHLQISCKSNMLRIFTEYE
jgi:hypothetical protein